jgi:hypothetical protein
MNKEIGRTCFRLLAKLNANNEGWKRAVSWLYHHEPESEVVMLFALTDEQLASAKRAVSILGKVKAEYDTVHAWANK